MNFEQAMYYMEHTSMFHKTQGLSGMQKLLHALGDPQDGLRFIHIAGTNGKGSTASMLNAVLLAAGYRVGLFTSPYIHCFNERVQVNGQLIPDETIAQMITRIVDTAEQIGTTPNYFDLATALSLLYFAQEQCDIVVFEVGLGGRFDPTNVISCPDAAVIAHIGLDHMEYLGSSIEQIAREKAGIIKKGGDVVLYAQDAAVESEIIAACKAQGARLFRTDAPAKVYPPGAGSTFDAPGLSGLTLGLKGDYQISNAMTVLKTIEVLRQKGWVISDEHIRTGLKNAQWPGRFEFLHERPTVLVDGAHNPQGAKSLHESLVSYFPGKKITFVMGALKDKNYLEGIQLLAPIAKAFYTVSLEGERALSAQELGQKIQPYCPNVTPIAHIADALAHAQAHAAEDDIICVFGSLYLVGAVREYYQKG